MKPKQKPTSRRFLGQLFPDRNNANFEKAHLRAYLKGHERFAFGRMYGDKVWHNVKQESIYN